MAHVSPLDRIGKAGLWAIAALMLLVYAPTALWLADRWSLGVWFHTHGWAVPPLVAWLIHAGLKRVGHLPRDASRWGFAFVLPAIFLLQIPDAVLRFELLSAVSLVLMIPGLSLLLLGRARTKAIWFGLFFLVFAVPIPLVVVRQVHMILRRIAVVGTDWTMTLIGYPVDREGTMLTFGNGQRIQIADACSGFSTLMALTMAGLLMIYLARGTTARRVATALLIFPIAAFANILRCVALAMLLLAFPDADILGSWIHPFSGMVTFVVALLLFQGGQALLMPAPKRKEAAC